MELTSRRDARFRVPLAIQTTKYRVYLRHAYVFLRSLPRQWNCRATIVRPYRTKIQDLVLTSMPPSPPQETLYIAGSPTSRSSKSKTHRNNRSCWMASGALRGPRRFTSMSSDVSAVRSLIRNLGRAPSTFQKGPPWIIPLDRDAADGCLFRETPEKTRGSSQRNCFRSRSGCSEGVVCRTGPCWRTGTSGPRPRGSGTCNRAGVRCAAVEAASRCDCGPMPGQAGEQITARSLGYSQDSPLPIDFS